jgi:hypothetical protein
MSRFDAIRTDRSRPAAPVFEATPPPPGSAPARVGKKAVSGYFSPGLSQAVHLLAVEQNTSLQALLGEALDDLLRKYGKHPFGER